MRARVRMRQIDRERRLRHWPVLQYGKQIAYRQTFWQVAQKTRLTKAETHAFAT